MNTINTRFEQIESTSNLGSSKIIKVVCLLVGLNITIPTIAKEKDNKLNRVVSLIPNTNNIKDFTKNVSHFWGKQNISSNKGEIIVKFPEQSYKPSGEIVGGAGFIYSLNSIQPSLTEANLSYELKFEDGFDFVKGGKLPGFCGGSCPRGGADASEGFSTRFMWRKDGDLELYAYIPNKNGEYGESLGRGSFRFETGKYYKLEQYIKLNTPDKDNGVAIIYVDGEEVYRNDNIIFRDDPNIFIDSVLFSTFFGGSDTSWATQKDTSITFKNFKISY